ncbi:WD repeat-containing protein 6-like [Telopea speciosissima]|uniref:WD repeat-containing protein 6-like n=1 Tax=Telopea speciosissima TaxID=54955 RepID=UPI001CC4DD46|nr:WD repeat-containing protein 6-like [Telopea speciosissima]
MALEVRCPERCLLYSMRLWGNNLRTLHVASGTIYNEIIVWKLVPQGHCPSSGSAVQDYNDHSGPLSDNIQFNDQQYEAICLSRLIGHEGSIFRIAWSSDGSKLMSVSDDRSARFWTVNASGKNSDDLREVVHPGSIDLGERKDSFDKKRGAAVPGSVGLVLFGHNARIWDCCISDSLIVTASEDCTCRVWGMDGNQIKMIKEHTGRGIWRCLYDPNSSLLVTAGFDSSIKVHQLHPSFCGGSIKQNGELERFKDMTEVFTIFIPNLSEQLELMDSKSEYVRCLNFTREDTLYVATNHGYLHHVKLSDSGDVKWTELARVGEVPIVCMDILSMNPPNLLMGIEDWIAVGDGKGNVTVVRVSDDDCAFNVSPAFTWSAGIERQLLGTYWCKSLKHRHIFTADPRGMLKLWRITDPSEYGSDMSVRKHMVSLIAEFSSCFGTRIMCLNALLDKKVLVCGDQRGNLVVFPLLKDLLLAKSIISEVKIPPLNYFKGAHGISSVASITLATLNINQVEIRSEEWSLVAEMEAVPEKLKIQILQTGSGVPIEQKIAPWKEYNIDEQNHQYPGVTLKPQ